jgi:hypothetical protein
MVVVVDLDFDVLLRAEAKVGSGGEPRAGADASAGAGTVAVAGAVAGEPSTAADVVFQWATRASKRWVALLRGLVAVGAGCKDLVEPVLHHLRGCMLEARLEAAAASADSSAFGFVEAGFLRAIRDGVWVLVDNCNNAPPEVLERLNSLLEADGACVFVSGCVAGLVVWLA